MIKQIKEVIAGNGKLISIAILLFLFNQVFEFVVISLFDLSYSQLCKFDCNWYSDLVRSGYDLEPHGHPKMDAANWAFFPAFPLIARGVSVCFGVSAPAALIMTSKFFFLLSIFAVMKMSKIYFPKVPVLVSGSMVVFSPYAIYGNVGYTESLFLFFSSAFFCLLKSEKYIVAGLVGGGLSSVRLVGVFPFFSCVFVFLSNFFNEKRAQLDGLVFGAFLVPIGLAFFMLYLYFHVGDALAFSHVQRAWLRLPSNPLRFIVDGVQGDLINQYWAIMSLAVLIVIIFFFYKKMSELAISLLFCTILPLSTGLWAMPRYIFWQAPLLLFLAYLCSRHLIWICVLSIFAVGQVAMYLAWFSGEGWVV